MKKKFHAEAEGLLASYERIPENNNLNQLVNWLAGAVLFLIVRYIDGE